MRSKEANKTCFGNWVPVKMIAAPGILGLACLALGALHWPFLVAAGLLLPIAGYFAAARFLFSAKGGNLQDQVQELVIKQIDWDGKGKVLDIGCGNGPLTIKIARCYPEAQITGIDYWGDSWDYSMQICTRNAQASGVAERTTFRRASASDLPFEDESFDLIVSNLVFHEIRDITDKREAIREAMRVLKRGGVFVLQDLFLLKPFYGSPEELVNTLRGWGVSEVEFIRTCDEAFIPGLVKLPFMLGTLAILRGKK